MREESAGGAREGSESSGGARKTGERRKGSGGAKGRVKKGKCPGRARRKRSGDKASRRENDVSKRHMTWWRSAWWIRVDNGPHLRTARGRRRTWRAARRAAEQARDDDRVEETQSLAEEAEGEKWGRKKSNQGRRQHPAHCLALVCKTQRQRQHRQQPAAATAATHDRVPVSWSSTAL